jgi:hypothetical protein
LVILLVLAALLPLAAILITQVATDLLGSAR